MYRSTYVPMYRPCTALRAARRPRHSVLLWCVPTHIYLSDLHTNIQNSPQAYNHIVYQEDRSLFRCYSKVSLA